MDYNYNVKIESIELNLAHPSSKHKLKFTFFNYVFRSGNYNLIIQLNTCRKNEVISITTYGTQFYEYYMNKICVSNKKSVINLYAELISATDDQDKSNSFHIQKLVNFKKEESYVLKKNEKKEIEFPYWWLFTENEGITKEIILGKYNLRIENLINLENKIIFKKIANISVKKNNLLAAIEWKIKEVNLNTPFFEKEKIFFSKTEKNNQSWDIDLNIHTKREENTDKILIAPEAPFIGLNIPFFNSFSPLTINFKLSADFLYFLNYDINLTYVSEYSIIFSTSCTEDYLYCVKVNSLTGKLKAVKTITIKFSNNDLEDFLYSGFNQNWFDEWKKIRIKDKF